VLVTVATCFLGYEAIRRLRPLRPLFGLERGERQPTLAPAGVAAAPRLTTESRVPCDVN
jgi:hypothetical protein